MNPVDQDADAEFTDIRDFHGYRLIAVYGRDISPYADNIRKLWKDNKVIRDSDEIEDRLDQVVVVAQNDNRQVVGVSTAYEEFRPLIQKKAYMYRMFIRKGDRATRMMIAMTRYSFDVLKNHEVDDKPEGVMIITENRKMMRKGAMRYFPRMGFTLLGTNADHHHIWVQPF